VHFLVTGGTGLIGRNFIQSRPNDRFTVLTRNSQASINHSAVEWIHSLDKLTDLDFADGVINLAGEPLVGRRWSDVGKKSIKASRIETTRRLIELVASSQNPPQLFLSGSAIGVYGNAGDQACLESQSIALDSYDFPQSLCYEWESIANALNLPDSRYCAQALFYPPRVVHWLKCYRHFASVWVALWEMAASTCLGFTFKTWWLRLIISSPLILFLGPLILWPPTR